MIKKETIIQDWGFDKYNYWNGVIYIVINDNKIFLCKTFYYNRNLCLKTIYDYSSKTYVIDCINKIIKKSQLLEEHSTYSLKDF